VPETTPSGGEGRPDSEREARRAARLEAPLMRLVATAGIIGIGVAIAAITT
jgi:hypothetical protein